MTNTSTDNGKKVAAEILKQLGGNQFIAMTGSHTFVCSENMIGMKLRRNKSGANYLRITLDVMDTYKMEFISIRGMELTTKVEFENVYNDQLQNRFTEATGLDTRL